MRAYQRAVSHPRANVIADEIFRAKVFPGDTDLRVFRDFGDLDGIDLVVIEDGFGYHTAKDCAERVAATDLARMGGQLLALTLELVRELPPRLEARRAAALLREGGGEEEVEEEVFFDVLGQILIAYPSWLGTRINLAASLLGLAAASSSLCGAGGRTGEGGRGGGEGGGDRGGGLTHVVVVVVSLLGPLLGGGLVGIVMNVLSPLAWYSDLRLCFVLYLSPAAAAALWCALGGGGGGCESAQAVGGGEGGSGQAYTNFDTHSSCPWRAVARELREILGVLSVLLLVMTAARLRSAYAVLLWVLCLAMLLAKSSI